MKAIRLTSTSLLATRAITPNRSALAQSSRSLPHTFYLNQIYRIDPNCDYGSLASLIRRADQTIDTEQSAEHWDRMGQLYASLTAGHVTASVALKRLVGFVCFS